jgi:hypothetical protein
MRGKISTRVNRVRIYMKGSLKLQAARHSVIARRLGEI